ncbi:right-handed parallel beta-helix repeat-containing protein [Leclercia adecarboxylata]|jgi:pectate disaccharide-lyase|uniref:right-handed parallel beta-helix repeat-containing protein n=1 Tax=Leclercia TaxID=83654 RepID=UPI000CDC22CE|nr:MULTISPECIES: right-handed parallel beta-helix repeat-containing protein [Leclercia]POW67863.1 pectate lyase [Leclercia sp. LSNIH4]AUY39405.1 pectate lyase [Leclercia sp. LSNIH3]MDQ2130037.1 right-handed parallel beta-helix repeat-containing protein [Leclercia adecarboxylata]MDV7058294.1 right-handed parallel beta-helix repeat-containing protein [Leclercia adecarboxylata]QIG35351.1 right-handed parallel beta-helix repeat-containing protein [Leclercia adecarboxylata]
MKSKIPLALMMCSAFSATANDQPHIWKAIAFGQSTDVNFSSNVLPEKIGVNDVTIDGKKLLPQESADLAKAITLESRGGKIANSHDGLTFFYTELPTDENFVLQANIRVDQFGPENGAKPAAQEGAGLLVRDVLGNPRQQPLKTGYEEFPAASNLVMNAIMTQDKKDHQRVKMQAITREGIRHPWGDAGAAIKKQSYKEEVDLSQTPEFRLKLQRTDDGFITAWAPLGSDNWVSKSVPRADLISVQNQEHYYVGFFASRNAKITVTQASLTTTPAHTVTSTPWQAEPLPLMVQLASGNVSASGDYLLQARANEDGVFSVRQNEVVIGNEKAVKAGEMYTLPTRLEQTSTFTVAFTPSQGTPVNQQLTVERVANRNTALLYAAPDGKADAKGTLDAPLDLATAIALLAPGGKLVLKSGDYPRSEIPLSASGSRDKIKTLQAEGKVVIHGLLLDASYWHIEGIDVTDKSLRVQGSHNLIARVTAYRNDDTGIQISSPEKIGRPLWASYNRVVDSESYANEDPGKINADGFAVKMRVGEGNRLENCYAHDNVDDGFDLFNKIEDGANGVVVIENSVASNNTSNGFKLGGEGQPVAHQIRNSKATGNHLDGFTDNFNPGKLVVENNLAVDNQRFNYIFRPSPYGDVTTQGTFTGNLSIRNQPGEYDDAVVGNIDNTNYFIVKGKSVNTDGKVLDKTQVKAL